MTWVIILVMILAFWLYLKIKQRTCHKSIINKQVLVEYFDQNTNFETIFPLTGIVTKKIIIGNQEFFVVQFDNSFIYQNNEFDKIIIKERHAGHYIGEDGETHVHVCLPKKELTQDKYELADVDHVVWATIKNL